MGSLVSQQGLRSRDQDNRLRGAGLGLAAAALFGASPPLSKLLLPASGPLALAGLLDLGAGLGLSVFRVRSYLGAARSEARLRASDLRLLATIAITGGILGPFLMLVGLQQLPALTSSLLLNLEAPLTVLLAVAFFGEHLDRREVASAVFILLGAAILAYQPGEIRGGWLGSLSLAGACLSWAIDNNLTQRLSLRDPVAVAQFKTLTAGLFSFALALILQQPIGSAAGIGAALLLGSVSYGLSLVLNTRALRILGAARQAALFATAPFVGALLAIPVLGERPRWADGLGAVAMVIGVAWFLGARHSHKHTHEPLEHDHLHVHDEHHRHQHAEPPIEPHSHLHRHELMTHDHSHLSDAHHRHTHLKSKQ